MMARPSRVPGTAAASIADASAPAGPTEPPPATTRAATGGCGCGGDSGAGAGAAPGGFAGIGSGDAAPAIRPPEEGLGAGITAWLSDKRITGVWSINQNRNSWVHVNGVGWRKLANNSDTAVVALTVLGSHARQTQTRVDYREEADGLLHEMYVW